MRSRRMPALFTSTWRSPNASTAESTSRLAPSKSVMSSWLAMASPPVGLDLGDDLLGGRGVGARALGRAAEVVDDDLGALGGEQERVLPPDAAAGSGDDGHPAVELVHVCRPPAEWLLAPLLDGLARRVQRSRRGSIAAHGDRTVRTPRQRQRVSGDPPHARTGGRGPGLRVDVGRRARGALRRLRVAVPLLPRRPVPRRRRHRSARAAHGPHVPGRGHRPHPARHRHLPRAAAQPRLHGQAGRRPRLPVGRPGRLRDRRRAGSARSSRRWPCRSSSGGLAPTSTCR